MSFKKESCLEQAAFLFIIYISNLKIPCINTTLQLTLSLSQLTHNSSLITHNYIQVFSSSFSSATDGFLLIIPQTCSGILSRLPIIKRSFRPERIVLRITLTTTSFSTSPTSLTRPSNCSERSARNAPIKKRKFHSCNASRRNTLLSSGSVHSAVMLSRRLVKKSASIPPINGAMDEKNAVMIFLADR